MNTKLTLLAIIEILSAMSMGIVILAGTYQFLKYWGKKRYDIQSTNQAYGIFIAAVLFSVGLTMSSVIQPLLSLFRIFASRDMGSVELALKFIGYGGIPYCPGLHLSRGDLYLRKFHLHVPYSNQRV